MRPSLLRIIVPLITVLALAPSGAQSAEPAGEVNLYSYRQPFLIRPMLDAFSEQTGIKVNVVFAKKGMLERIRAEGRNTAADAVLTVDIGRLNDMVRADVLQAVDSPVLDANIPAQYRHPDGLWFGLTTRGRVFLVSRDRVKPGELETYASLAEPEARGRVCMRSGKHVYNVSLIASMIAHLGEDGAEQWLKGVKENLARRPQGNDRAQVKAVYQGVCDVAVANTYYMGKMVTNDKQPEQKEWAASVRVVFPDQDGRGTHMNISGAAVTKYARNRDNAVKLIEFLSEDFAQRLYADQNFEYPVNGSVSPSELVSSWGEFKADDTNLAEVAKHRPAATKLVDRVGFNN
ncbi:MAG: Fe(3+) ABC transporter substrate-binding protein [Gammaproteobacteria bacterium]